MLVRKVRCPSCGAPKLTASRSAYVYCDYCARFMDWDAQNARHAGDGAPARDKKLVDRLDAKLEAARKSGDRDALAAAHRAVSDRVMTDFVHGYSPRIRDPKYREAMLARTVHAAVVTELDPGCQAANAKLATAGAGLEYDIVGEAVTVKAKTFWRLFDAMVAAQAASRAALVNTPHVVPDPDDTTPELSAKMLDSAMAQTWLNLLDHATGQELLARTHLQAEYEEVPDPILHDTPCSHCSAILRTPAGARQAVCESCGHVAVLGQAAFCGFCGAPIAFAAGADATSCGSCKAETRVITDWRG